jgi:hypothetical protein
MLDRGSDPMPIAIPSAMRAGARPLGASIEVAYWRWHEWAIQQRDLITGSKPGITHDEYEPVAQRFTAVGLMVPA